MPSPPTKLALLQIANDAYQISHKDQNVDIDLTIWEKADERGRFWTLDLIIMDKIPSDLCTMLEECDYGDAEQKNGVFKPCIDCNEKCWAQSSTYEGAASYEQAILKANTFMKSQRVNYVVE